MMTARRSAIFSGAKPPTSGSRKLKKVYEMSGSIALKIVTPSAVQRGSSFPSASSACGRKVPGRFSTSSSLPPKASQRDWSSSMIEISTRPICGIFLPRIARTSGVVPRRLRHARSPR